MIPNEITCGTWASALGIPELVARIVLLQISTIQHEEGGQGLFLRLVKLQLLRLDYYVMRDIHAL
jgi:hypothetical protein